MNDAECINNRLDQADERICKLQDRSFEFIQSVEKKNIRIKKSKEILCELLNITKWNNVHIIGIPGGGGGREGDREGEGGGGREREKERTESLLKKIMHGASLVAQWLRICLLMQGTRV